MKHVLRVIVTILVLTALGFGAYFIWFKPDGNLAVFEGLNDLAEYERQIGLENNFADLIEANGHGNVTVKIVTKTYDSAGVLLSNTEKTEGYSNAFIFDYDMDFLPDYGLGTNPYAEIISKVNYNDILVNRELILNGRTSDLKDYEKVNLNSTFGLAQNSEDIQYSFASYSVLEKYLDEIYSSYIAYTQVAKGVTNSAIDYVNDEIDDYKVALSTLNNSIESVIRYQNVYNYDVNTLLEEVEVKQDTEIVEGNTVKKFYYVTNYEKDNNSTHTELANRYNVVMLNYREALSEYVSLIKEIKDFVKEFVFDGEIINEVNTIKYDMLLLSIENAVSDNYETTEEKQKVCVKMADTAVFIKGATASAFEENAQELLDTYNEVAINYYEGLEKVMELTPLQKREFISNTATQPEINKDYANSLVNLLKLYGYEGIETA